jgi:hypothetical protein
MVNLTLSTDNNLTIDVKPIVTIETGISLMGYKTELPVTITADFTNIPKEQHEVFLQSFQYYYEREINIHHNLHSDNANLEPKTIREKKKGWRLNRIIDILLGKNGKNRTSSNFNK